MTGLDLESFLLLLRADLSTWTILGLGTLGLAFLVWSCWGSRRALRKCLVLSLAAHLVMVLYGSTVPAVLWAVDPDRRDDDGRDHIRKIRVSPLVESSQPPARVGLVASAATLVGDADLSLSSRPSLDLGTGAIGLGESTLRIPRGARAAIESGGEPEPKPAGAIALPTATPEMSRGQAAFTADGPIVDAASPPGGGPPPAQSPAPMDDVERPTPGEPLAGDSPAPSPRDFILETDRRLRPRRQNGRASAGGGSNTSTAGDSALGQFKPDSTTVRRDTTGPGPAMTAGRAEPLSLSRATPRTSTSGPASPSLASLGERAAARPLADVPKVYQPRLDPDRLSNAKRIGATAASEQAVERALDWLARHQDREDGRWNGGIARYDDGTPVRNDKDYTAHCPPGETCFGECAYWEADTALTGLALLTFLGAGHTQANGRFGETIAKGVEFLISQQKPDGDLRGESRVVGMYCHAMATLALCEALALSGDDRLRSPVERAVQFLANGRARDGLAWRYAPGAPVGDTSILGWIVMGLKSAKEVGIPIPNDQSLRDGTLRWLDKVAAGTEKGLARYQPWESPTPTMTAEAWVCRQFLGVGGPGPASTEAAQFLLSHHSDRGPSNMYYWYYATLALYQHGGDSWTLWNSTIRDRIVALQIQSGHQTGSWNPDGSLYGPKGGRIYSTTLATLTLEVYYRYLRLYDDPRIPIDDRISPELSSQK